MLLIFLCEYGECYTVPSKAGGGNQKRHAVILSWKADCL